MKESSQQTDFVISHEEIKKVIKDMPTEAFLEIVLEKLVCLYPFKFFLI